MIVLLDVPRLDAAEVECAGSRRFVCSGGGSGDFLLGRNRNARFYNEKSPYADGEGLLPAPLSVPSQLLRDPPMAATDVSVADHPDLPRLRGLRAMASCRWQRRLLLRTRIRTGRPRTGRRLSAIAEAPQRRLAAAGEEVLVTAASSSTLWAKSAADAHSTMWDLERTLEPQPCLPLIYANEFGRLSLGYAPAIRSSAASIEPIQLSPPQAEAFTCLGGKGIRAPGVGESSAEVGGGRGGEGWGLRDHRARQTAERRLAVRTDDPRTASRRPATSR